MCLLTVRVTSVTIFLTLLDWTLAVFLFTVTDVPHKCNTKHILFVPAGCLYEMLLVFLEIKHGQQAEF